MLILSPQTSQSLGPLTRHLMCVIFVQCRPPVGPGPIKIEGTKDPATRLRAIDHDNAFETYWIGMLPTETPEPVAQAIYEQYATAHLRNGWFAPTVEVLTYVQHVAQRPLQELLARLQPHSHPDGTATIEEIASLLGVSIPTVRRMVKAGTIPYLRLGRQLRFLPADVVASLQRGGSR